MDQIAFPSRCRTNLYMQFELLQCKMTSENGELKGHFDAVDPRTHTRISTNQHQSSHGAVQLFLGCELLSQTRILCLFMEKPLNVP